MPDDVSDRVDDALTEIRQHGRKPAEVLLPIIYDELRVLAQQRLSRMPPGHTLQATALVNEAYLRIVRNVDPGWDGAGHLFGAFAIAMRNILVDHARTKGRQKRGGDWRRIDIDPEQLAFDVPMDDEQIVAMDEALDRLMELDDRKARVVMLRFFAGCSTEDIGRMLECSTRTVERDWDFARVWLHREMDGSSEPT